MIYIVPGYGLPKDIRQDDVYPKYLRVVEEYILNQTDKSIKLIFCGGNTDMFYPFERTEAEEMMKLWIETYGNDFTIVIENKSLSSLDNQLYAKNIIDENHWGDDITIICERTRYERIKLMAKMIYKQRTEIVPVDLYNSDQLKDLHLLEAKENKEIEMVKWALSNSDNLKNLRKLFEQKFEILRKIPEELREEKLKEMYKKLLEMKF